MHKVLPSRHQVLVVHKLDEGAHSRLLRDLLLAHPARYAQRVLGNTDDERVRVRLVGRGVVVVLQETHSRYIFTGV